MNYQEQYQTLAENVRVFIQQSVKKELYLINKEDCSFIDLPDAHETIEIFDFPEDDDYNCLPEIFLKAEGPDSYDDQGDYGRVMKLVRENGNLFVIGYRYGEDDSQIIDFMEVPLDCLCQIADFIHQKEN